MFAPPVAKPQAKADASSNNEWALERSAPAWQFFGDGGAEHMRRLQRSIGTQAVLRLLAQPASGPAGSQPRLSAGVIRMLQQTIGNQAVLRLLEQRASGNEPAAQEKEADAAREATPGVALDFSKIPVVAPDPTAQPEARSVLTAPPLPGAIQAKLEVGQVDDPLEHEADRVADQVTRMPAPEVSVAAAPPQLNRKCAGCKEEFILSETPAQLEGDRGKFDNRTGIPNPLKLGLEALSGFDLSDIRVHRDSPKPAELNALAYAQGREIHLGPSQDQHLPHEGWHVVQQMQGRVEQDGIRAGYVAINVDPRLEAEADRMGKQALDPALAHRPQPHQHNVHIAGQPNPPVQLEVRINGGAQRVNEPYYQTGGGKSIGSKRSVAALIADGVRRVFFSSAGLEEFANGKTDWVGDVATQAAGTFWYRLPKTKLTVLGEIHENPQGNVEDVILGLQTSRFKYEAFNELANVTALNIPFTGTQSRLTQVNAGLRVAGLVDRTKFNPDLENIVIKALTGASITRNEFPANPSTMSAGDKKQWERRASTSDYSYGERVALYLSIGIHLASDISKYNFGPPNSVESLFIKSGRALQEFYLKNQSVLDAFMQAKDSDDLIGIYELTAPDSFKNLPVIKDFTLVLHDYASRYIEQLGAGSGNKQLEAEGKALSGNLSATVDTLNPAREEIMWEKIQQAVSKGYLIVGMGDRHRTNLEPRLNKAGIPHEKVAQSLTRQKAAIDAAWKP